MLQMLMHFIELLKNFITLKAEVDKLDFNKLVNVPAILNNWKPKADDLNAGKFKNIPINFKKLR